MADQSSVSSPRKDSSLSSLPLAVPDGKSARDAQGHFLQPFKLAAVRYAVASGKSQKAAALDMGLSDKTLGEWVRDARPGGGALRRELTACLRTGRTLRIPRARTRGRGKPFISAETMISRRPAEVADRAVPGH